uniref:KIB1-4 beta-propeller domain-containing protein n=1 Tax=Oryza barthii TaxID=65489 RepID=A0A0D3FSE8_9ORYZ
MRGHVIIGSSGGWLVTADERGRMRLANPVTGEQGDLPAITTIPFVNDTPPGGEHFVIDMDPMQKFRCRGELECGCLLHPHPRGTFVYTVVLSASPRPGDYAAMLLLDNYFDAPAFAMAEDGRWRVAPSRDGVEDAIHYKASSFPSVTYTGVVEAWARDSVSGEFTRKVVTSRMANGGDHRKYLSAAPDGRLMIVVKNTKGMKQNHFKVQVFDEMTQRWEAAEDMGDLALLVGINSSLCVSTTKHPELKAGCVYYTGNEIRKASDEIGKASESESELMFEYFPGMDFMEYGMYDMDVEMDHIEIENGWLRSAYRPDSKQHVGVYSLRDGTVESIPDLGKNLSWPPPAWFIPSFP